MFQDWTRSLHPGNGKYKIKRRLSRGKASSEGVVALSLYVASPCLVSLCIVSLCFMPLYAAAIKYLNVNRLTFGVRRKLERLKWEHGAEKLSDYCFMDFCQRAVSHFSSKLQAHYNLSLALNKLLVATLLKWIKPAFRDALSTELWVQIYCVVTTTTWECFQDFVVWTPSRLSHHWAWPCWGYWHDGSLIDWLMNGLIEISLLFTKYSTLPRDKIFDGVITVTLILLPHDMGARKQFYSAKMIQPCHVVTMKFSAILLWLVVFTSCSKSATPALDCFRLIRSIYKFRKGHDPGFRLPWPLETVWESPTRELYIDPCNLRCHPTGGNVVGLHGLLTRRCYRETSCRLRILHSCESGGIIGTFRPKIVPRRQSIANKISRMRQDLQLITTWMRGPLNLEVEVLVVRQQRPSLRKDCINQQVCCQYVTLVTS